jgi:hypothetical protein
MFYRVWTSLAIPSDASVTPLVQGLLGVTRKYITSADVADFEGHYRTFLGGKRLEQMRVASADEWA